MAEALKAAQALMAAAARFSAIDKLHGRPMNVPAAVKCLLTALSLVLPPSTEVEIRAFLGELLLRYGTDPTVALDQLQKAHTVLQMIDHSYGLRFRLESSLVSAHLMLGSAQLATNMIRKASQLALKVREMSWWLHCFVLDLQLNGVAVMASTSGINLQDFSDEHRLLYCTLVGLGTFRASPTCLASNQLVELESQMEASEALGIRTLLALLCLSQRISFDLFHGFREVVCIYDQLLEQLKTNTMLKLECHMSLNASQVLVIVEVLVLLAKTKFSLAETKLHAVPNPMEASENLKAFLDISNAEMELLRGVLESCQVSDALTQLIFNACSLPDQAIPQIESAMQANFAADRSVKARLQILRAQCLATVDVNEARMELRRLRDSSDEALKTPGFFIVESIVLLKSDEPVHVVKESLLSALKLLNSPNERHDVLKGIVLLLLAFLYQSTDFPLAEKMAGPAYQNFNSLGNHRLALMAGTILAKVLGLNGKRTEAMEQLKANALHEQALNSMAV